MKLGLAEARTGRLQTRSRVWRSVAPTSGTESPGDFAFAGFGGSGSASVPRIGKPTPRSAEKNSGSDITASFATENTVTQTDAHPFRKALNGEFCFPAGMSAEYQNRARVRVRTDVLQQ